MQQRGLTRDYFFEFAGMPQSGKSTIEEIVAHFLKRQGFPIEEYRGGSRYSPLRFAPIADLNMLLACKVVEFVVSTSEREKAVNKIFLLDRGLIDRYMFTETLLRRGQIDSESAHATRMFLTSPQLMRKIDGVFVFITTPELAMIRENQNKLVANEGGVMNRAFLREMRSAIEDDIAGIKMRMSESHLELINTSENNRKETETARRIADTILKTIYS